MDHQSLRNVLGILRLVRGSQQQRTPLQFIADLTGAAEPIAFLKIAAYIVEQVQTASTVIANSGLSAEAREGVQALLKTMELTFGLSGLGSPMSALTVAAPGAISNFVILLDAMGATEPPVPDDVAGLREEIDEVLSRLGDIEIDPAVRDVALRHLEILATLLRHIPIFGLEPALTTYFELMMKVRRADSGASEASHSKFEPLWEKMQKWGERLGHIDKVWNAGARLLGAAQKAGELLSYHPPH